MSKRRPRVNVPDQGTPSHGPTSVRTTDVLSPQIPYGKSGVVEANWEIAARVAKHTLGWRDELEVHLYFAGYGIPEWAKVAFYPPLGVFGTSSVANEEPLVSVTSSISTAMPQGIAEDAIPEGTQIFAIRDVHTINVTQHGANMKVPTSYFFPLLTSRNPGGSRDMRDAEVDLGHRTVAEVDISEMKPDGTIARFQPYLIRARIPFWAASGDYSVPFILSYSTAGRVKSSTYRLEFHIKSFWEKSWFQATVLSVAVAAVVVAVAQWFGIFRP
jgi:hypothetical protein